MAKILESDVPVEAQREVKTLEELIAREKNVYWSSKKWCGEILTRFVQKYGNPNWGSKKDIPFAQKIMKDYLGPILEITIKILIKSRVQFVSERFRYFLTRYCYFALRNDAYFPLLNKHLEGLLLDVFIHTAALTLTDLYYWETDPVEFVHKQADYTSMATDLRSQSLEMIGLICKKNAPDKIPYLYKFMKFAQDVLDSGANPRTNQKADERLIESILNCIAFLHDQIREDYKVSEKMEIFLAKYVVPCFESQSGLFRAVACKLFGVYGQRQFKIQENVIRAAEGISRCLTDKELPVRVYVNFFL